MQTIELKQFGTVLVSRPAGLEAFNALRPTLNPAEKVRIDFTGVITVTPSWFDEFLTQLATFLGGNVVLLPTDNASLQAALPILMQAHDDDLVARILKQALDRSEPTV